MTYSKLLLYSLPVIFPYTLVYGYLFIDNSKVIEMKKLLPVLSVSVLLMTSVWGETLDDIIVQDTIDINPNAVEPENTNRVKPTSSDGGDFLTQINGVSMSRFGGRGVEPIVRGQSQTRLNVLLDGAYIHGGCPNRMDPPASWAALETYESVTVLKGVQTLAYGSGGSGGTVLFERDTRALAQEKGIHGRVSAMASDNAIESDVLADVVAAGQKVYLRGIGEIKKATNYVDGGGREVRSSYDHQQGGIIMGFTPTEDRLVEFSYEHNAFSDALYPGASMDSPEEDGDIFRLRYLDKPATDKIDNIKAEIYLSDVDHLMDNYSLRKPSSSKKLMATPTTSKTTGGRLVLDSSVRNTQWKYGIDMQRNERNAVSNNMASGTAKQMGILWPNVDIQQLGAFAEGSTKFSTNKKLKYGLRVDQVDITADKAATKVMKHAPNDSYMMYYGVTAEDKTETNVGGLLRYEQNVGKGVTFFTGLSRSVRTADATERGMNKWTPAGKEKARWIGNPDINPEKHHQFDIGLSKNTNSLALSGVMFFDKVSDYILRDTARGQDGVVLSDGAEIYRNVDAELYGIELDAKYSLTDKLSVTGGLAYVRATNTTDDRPIAQTPPLNGKLQMDYSQGKWGIGTRLNFADNQSHIDDLSRQEVGETAGHETLDLYGNYQLNRTFSLRAGVDNIFDKNYANHASRSNLMDTEAIKVNEPGRTAWLKVVAEF